MAYVPPDLGDDWNLDCMSIDPSDLSALANHLGTLAEYARLKSEAMRYRASGHTQRAFNLESQCEILYATLPANWRW